VVAGQEAFSISATRGGGGRHQWPAAVLRDPFVHFALLGLLIWVGNAYWSAHRDRYLIRITASDRQRVATSYYRQFGVLPTSEQLEQLMDHYIREEIYLREGKALNLDVGDEIIRRRIVQKYEFLQSDLAVNNIPTPTQLQQWFKQNSSRYLVPERVAFSHIFVSVDHDGESAARARAIKILADLRAHPASRASDHGDPFPGPSDVPALRSEEVSRLFGQSELTQEIFNLLEKQWSGPYRSGFGWHLVYVTGKVPAFLPSYDAVHDRALADYQEAKRRESNGLAFRKLRAKYTVRDDDVVRRPVVLPISAGAPEPPRE